jgi:hypothetical protein
MAARSWPAVARVVAVQASRELAALEHQANELDARADVMSRMGYIASALVLRVRADAVRDQALAVLQRSSRG